MKKVQNSVLILAILVGMVLVNGCEENEPVPISETLIVPGAEPPVEDCEIDHRTQTPGGWGAKAAGNNPGSLVDKYFDLVFPNDLHVGCFSSEGKCLYLTSAEAVETFLPSGGKPAVLVEREIVDPGKKELKNSLAGHIVALTLSIHYDHYLEDFGDAEYLLCDLVVCSGTFRGESVSKVLEVANKVIGGCSTEYTIDEVYNVISSINENFVDGEINNGFLCCPNDIKYQI